MLLLKIRILVGGGRGAFLIGGLALRQLLLLLPWFLPSLVLKGQERAQRITLRSVRLTFKVHILQMCLSMWKAAML